jgi:hypothetical protein
LDQDPVEGAYGRQKNPLKKVFLRDTLVVIIKQGGEYIKGYPKTYWSSNVLPDLARVKWGQPLI